MTSTRELFLALEALMIWLAHAAQGAIVPNETSTCFCLRRAAGDLHSPVAMLPLGDGGHVIAEQRGQVWQEDPRKSDARQKLLDLSGRVLSSPQIGDERGLLGIALHPGYPTPSKLYVYYTREEQGQLYSYVSEVSVVPGGDGPPEKERVLLRIPQPHPRGNGGQILFGKDGLLYVFVGHGGNSSDPLSAYAQNPRSFLGKVLRLDVENRSYLDGRPLPYGVPQDNPWVGNASWLPEIFATGVRNMWRCSQDMGADASGRHRIFCGDTGESSFEEVDIIEKGRNYGWNLKEGLTCFNRTECGGIEREGQPIYVYEHAAGGANAVVGGYVYRGRLFPALTARYVFGDVMRGDVFLLREEEGAWHPSRWNRCPPQQCACDARESLRTFLLSFAQDKQGELYALTTSTLNAHQPGGAVLQFLPPLTNPESAACGACCLTLSQCLLLLASLLALPRLPSLP